MIAARLSAEQHSIILVSSLAAAVAESQQHASPFQAYPWHYPPPPASCAGIWFREWAPGAKAMALVGEFNNWEPRQQDWAVKNEYGVWCLFMPDNPDGSSAIPHR